MVGRLSVGLCSHYQLLVEPGFTAGTFILPVMTFKARTVHNNFYYDLHILSLLVTTGFTS